MGNFPALIHVLKELEPSSPPVGDGSGHTPHVHTEIIMKTF